MSTMQISALFNSMRSDEKVSHESEDPLLDHEEGHFVQRTDLRVSYRKRLIVSVVNGVVFIASIVLFAISSSRFTGRNAALKETSIYCELVLNPKP